MIKYRIALSVLLLLIFNFSFSQNVNNSNFNFGSNNFSYWSWSLENYGGATVRNTTWSHYNFNQPPAGLTNVKHQMERTGTTNPTFSTADTAIKIIPYNGSPDRDTYVGAFSLQKVPRINGYQYPYSVKLGNRVTGNKARKISYSISVPAGVTNYIITYAYALVLQDPSHDWTSQPRFTAALRDPSRAPGSPEYLLNNQKDTIKCASVAYNVTPDVFGNTVAQNLAKKNAQGFFYANANNTQEYYKDWVEVQTNLGAYAGKTIILDFESDDCSAGGHWGYAYFALRDNFDAPVISGNSTICSNGSQVYSIPSTAGVSYTWSIPSGWGTSSPASTSNTITVTPANNSGYISVTPNSAPCGNAVSSSLYVTYGSIPGDPGAPSGPTTVCASGGAGSSNLTYSISPVSNATDYDWTIPNSWSIVSGGDGTTNVVVNVPSNANGNNSISVVAKNGCGNSANAGISSLSVAAFAPSVGGTSSISSGNSTQCINSSDIVLTSSGKTGDILKWQKSTDGGTSWNDIASTIGSSTYTLTSPSQSAMYRFDVQNGTCPEAFSTNTAINIINPPQITLQPASKGVCTGSATSFNLNAISNDASITYQWFRRINSSSSWVSVSNTLDGNIYSASGTAATLTISNATGLDSYEYYCLITGATCGNTSSNVVTLSVSSASTSISSQPSPRAVCSGSTVTLTASALGANLTYQWYSRGAVNSNSGGSIINGQTSNSYSFAATNGTGSQITNYYYLVATSTCSPNTATASTNATAVTIDPSATVSVSISNPPATICNGDNITFTANPTNPGSSPSYIWTKNSVQVGTNANTYVTNNLTTGDIIGVSLNSNVVCAVGNPASAVPLAALTVYALPSVAAISGPSVVNAGSTIQLTNTTVGGVWSSTSAGNATVSSGLVTGVMEGTSTINYVVSDNHSPACTNTATKNITVNDLAPSALSYTTPNEYTKGTAITALTPTVSGGTVTGYTIAPSLPTGLVINATTGVISGTSSVVTAATNYTVTASNTGGSVTTVVNITVNDLAPSALSYTTPNEYTKGTAITALTPTVSGGTVTGYTIAPSLPTGLVINATTGVISGTSSVVTAATNYTVTASNTGGSVTTVVNIKVKDVASIIEVTGLTTYTYNKAAQGPVTSTVTGSTAIPTYSYSGTGTTNYGPSAILPIDAGTYQVVATVAADVNFNGATSAAYAFTILKATTTLVVTGDATYTYNSLQQGPITSAINGSTGAVTYSYSGTGSTTYVASTALPKNPGSYQVIAKVVTDMNYNEATSDAFAFIIKKATSSIVITGLNSFTYNASAQGPATSTVIGSTGAVTYSYSGINSTTYNQSASAPKLPGTYQVIANLEGDNNYESAISAAYLFSIIQIIEPPVVEDVKIIFDPLKAPKTLAALVVNRPTGTIPAWCDVNSSNCTTVAPAFPTLVGKYVFRLRSFDTVTMVYSTNFINNIIILSPSKPIAKDSTYIIGLATNPPNLSLQVSGEVNAKFNYYFSNTALAVIPTLGNMVGIKRYTVSQTVNSVESDTVGFSVTMLNQNDMIHLQKIADAPILQSNSTFNITYKFVVNNLANSELLKVLVADNLMNTIPITSEYTVVKLNSSGGLVVNPNFNGSSDIYMTTSSSKLNANARDSILLTINVKPKGFFGVMNNSATMNATTPYGVISMISSALTKVAETSKTPTPVTIPDVIIDIPEVFSPNRDGVNDRFIIIKPFGTILQLEIFNRWGNIVYSNLNYNNEWDGRGTNNFIGQDLLDGGYYYNLKATNTRGETKIFKGFVIIQR